MRPQGNKKGSGNIPEPFFYALYHCPTTKTLHSHSHSPCNYQEQRQVFPVIAIGRNTMSNSIDKVSDNVPNKWSLASDRSRLESNDRLVLMQSSLCSLTD